LKGDTAKGKSVFTQYCIACHQKRGELGVHYGPDLGSVRNWLPKDIMANILSPNLSIAAGFDLWELETKSGEKVQGLLSSESSSAVTLLVGPGVPKIYNRQDIKMLKALNASAMTEGFAEKISQQEMADLISFLKE
jgi:putative heme-binding domain-containing protein